MKQSKLLLILLLAICSFIMNTSIAKTITPFSVQPLPATQLFKTANSITPATKAGKVPLGKFQICNKDGKMVDVYAAMEWEFTRFYEDGDIYKEYWDYYIRFYSDASHTSPYALTSSITFNYQWAYATSNPNDYGHWTQHATGNTGDFEVYIEEVEVYYADAFGWREVVLSMLPGSGYFL